MIKSRPVQHLEISSEELIRALLDISLIEPVCLLDSGNASRNDAPYLIAGLCPIDTLEITSDDAFDSLERLDALASGDTAAVFTLSYELGRKLHSIATVKQTPEPDVFISLFDALIIHDYIDGSTRITGDPLKAVAVKEKLLGSSRFQPPATVYTNPFVRSDFTRPEYLHAIELIKERIREGDTYQTNLTQQLSAELPSALSPETVFYRLRRDHPAPYSAFIRRPTSTVVSVSPELFFKIDRKNRRIITSPIKGTRPRGDMPSLDAALRSELLRSIKDRAENTMIVDLLRNDLGRICEYGSVEVESLCQMEEHPTLFHLVSTITGLVRPDVRLPQIIKSLFPCGSITGAPKLSTMKIIEELERSARGLSMGAIGCHIPERFGIGEQIEMSVAIRTMVIRDGLATFNVGGGIVIDSDPQSEYDETLTKAKALIRAIDGSPNLLNA